MQANKESREDAERRAMLEASELPQPSLVDIDPEDPSQLLDDAGQFSVVDLELDAEPQAEADAEYDAAVATTADDYIEIIDDPAKRDTGDLYGVHMPRAGDPDADLTDDREAFADSTLGENVFETLGHKMTEGGAQPEHEIDVEDDSDPEAGHHKSDMRDRPVADKGSGGPGGV